MASTTSFSDTDLLEPIAIVGLSLRFPGGANDLDSFWELITDARCVSREHISDRINIDGAYWPRASATVKGGHFIAEDVTAFDAPFFGISAVEAATMDPQQRLLLETSYMALENGKSIKKKGRTIANRYCSWHSYEQGDWIKYISLRWMFHR